MQTQRWRVQPRQTKGTEINLAVLEVSNKKVQVGNDQEKVQSEKNSHSKNRGGTYTMRIYRTPNEQLFSQ